MGEGGVRKERVVHSVGLLQCENGDFTCRSQARCDYLATQALTRKSYLAYLPFTSLSICLAKDNGLNREIDTDAQTGGFYPLFFL